MKKEFVISKFRNCIGDSRATYRFLNELEGTTFDQPTIKSIRNDKDTLLEEPADIANVGCNIQASIPDNAGNFNSLIEECDKSLWVYPVSIKEVEELIKNLVDKSSSGLDELSNVFINSVASVLVPHLEQLITVSFKEGVFPAKLKDSKVIPIHKGGAKDLSKNYRPISLLNTLSKVFERAMFNRVYNFLENFSRLYCNQFGFRKCRVQLMQLQNLRNLYVT